MATMLTLRSDHILSAMATRITTSVNQLSFPLSGPPFCLPRRTSRTCWKDLKTSIVAFYTNMVDSPQNSSYLFSTMAKVNTELHTLFLFQIISSKLYRSEIFCTTVVQVKTDIIIHYCHRVIDYYFFFAWLLEIIFYIKSA